MDPHQGGLTVAPLKDWTNQGYTKVADNIWESSEGIHFSEVDGILRNITNLSAAQAQRVGVTPEQLKASTAHNQQVLEEAKKRQSKAGQSRLEEPAATPSPTPGPSNPRRRTGRLRPPRRSPRLSTSTPRIIPPDGIGSEGQQSIVPVSGASLAYDIVRPILSVAEAMKAWNEYM